MGNFKTKRLVSGQFEFRPWSSWKEGDVLIGSFQSISSKPDNYGKFNYRFLILECSWDPTLEGKLIALNQLTQLVNLCDGLETGEIVRFEYKGKTELTKGLYKGKEAHSLDIAIVEEDEEDDL